MKWVTRERAKVDRIACPWMIRKFIDPGAEFLYVPADEVLRVAHSVGGVPYDTPGADLDHYTEAGVEYVTFDALIRKYRLADPALLELARIVRHADGGSAGTLEGPGLAAAATGFRQTATDDFENQRLQFPLYDALYAFCQRKLADAKS